MHGHGEAMTVPASAQKEVAELLSPTCSLGINTRLQKVLGILESHGLLYTRSLTPAAFLCHPQNRGGSMINGFNAHRKGNEILASGVKARPTCTQLFGCGNGIRCQPKRSTDTS